MPSANLCKPSKKRETMLARFTGGTSSTTALTQVGQVCTGSVSNLVLLYACGAAAAADSLAIVGVAIVIRCRI